MVWLALYCPNSVRRSGTSCKKPNDPAYKAVKILFPVLRCLIGGGIFIYLLVVFDLGAVIHSVGNADPYFLALAILGTFMIFALNAWQLVIAIRHRGVALTLRGAVSVNLVATFYSQLAFGDLIGGTVKWFRLARGSGKRMEVLATIIFLKFVNMGFILLVGLAAFFIENPFEQRIVIWIAVSMLAFMLILTVLVLREPESLKTGARWNRFPIPFLSRIGGILGSLVSNLKDFSRLPRNQAALILVIPALRLFLSCAVYFSIAQALGLRIPPLVLIWLQGLLFLIRTIPASVSGLGLREGALVLLLPTYGIEPSNALAFSLVVLGLALLMASLGGLLEMTGFFFQRPHQKTPDPHP